MVLHIPDGISRVPPYQDTVRYKDYFQYEGFLLFWLTFPCHSSIIFKSTLQSHNPEE